VGDCDCNECIANWKLNSDVVSCQFVYDASWQHLFQFDYASFSPIVCDLELDLSCVSALYLVASDHWLTLHHFILFILVTLLDNRSSSFYAGLPLDLLAFFCTYFPTDRGGHI